MAPQGTARSSSPSRLATRDSAVPSAAEERLSPRFPTSPSMGARSPVRSSRVFSAGAAPPRG